MKRFQTRGCECGTGCCHSGTGCGCHWADYRNKYEHLTRLFIKITFGTIMDQVTSHVLMIRQSGFGFNAETAANNTFQTRPQGEEVTTISQNAIKEFDDFVEILRKEGVDVTVIDDSSSPQKPYAVFPNNWISFHGDGTVVTYPMFSKLRRNERRNDIIEDLNSKFQVSNRLHLESFEDDEQYLEGTGSLVLDRAHKVANAGISDRTHHDLVEKWCSEMNYTPHTFHAFSGKFFWLFIGNRDR